MIRAAVSTLVTDRLPLGQQLKSTSALRSVRVHEWPQVMRGDLAWDSSTLPEEDTILTLAESEIAEVRVALQHFNREFAPVTARALRHANGSED